MLVIPFLGYSRTRRLKVCEFKFDGSAACDFKLHSLYKVPPFGYGRTLLSDGLSVAGLFSERELEWATLSCYDCVSIVANCVC